ncbi:MAG: calcium/sodium antiporter [Anaerolineae bacterium]|nr:calcium/sodium antiporter [Candidatus Roseilinea sp.]MDW8451194.1 calcium/sodium antiporter [Anaerolineae bacterium]
MDIPTLILFVVGLGLLIAGAEALVRGASRLAAAIGISPLIIGLTVVAFGTSAPEMAVSSVSALNGTADIAVGNVVGSNIFNVLFILGASALIAPLIVSQQLVRLDVPIMIGVSVLALIFIADGVLNRLEGAVLFAGIIAYITFLIVQSRKEKDKQVWAEYEQEFGEKPKGASGVLLNLGFIVAGLVALIVGSRWLVDGAVAIARALRVDEVVIGLTIVAGGTSLPEVATSIVASIRGERDIAVGNVVGSNIFNILAVLGMAGLVAPQGLPVSASVLHFDIWVMIAVALACLPIFFTGLKIARWEGALFLLYYAAYTAYLIFDATGNAALPAFRSAMLLFVVPLTVLTIAVTVFQEIRARRRLPATPA